MMTYGSLRSHGAREARRGLEHDLLLIVFDDPLRLADVLLLFIVYLDGSFERDEGNSSHHGPLNVGTHGSEEKISTHDSTAG